MRATLIPILLFFTLHAAAQQPAPLNLLPVPAQIQQNPDKFRVTGKFTMSVKGQSTDTILYRAVNRAYQALNRKTGSIFGQQYVSPGDTLTQASMQVLVNAQALVAPGVNESYTLNVDAAHVSLAAPNTIGALRGYKH
jgi:hexosaminidase